MIRPPVVRYRLVASARLALAIAAAASLLAGVAQAASVTLLNVSYDPTRELYQEFDRASAADR